MDTSSRTDQGGKKKQENINNIRNLKGINKIMRGYYK